jgi:hypothetical protein
MLLKCSRTGCITVNKGPFSFPFFCYAKKCVILLACFFFFWGGGGAWKKEVCVFATREHQDVIRHRHYEGI